MVSGLRENHPEMRPDIHLDLADSLWGQPSEELSLTHLYRGKPSEELSLTPLYRGRPSEELSLTPLYRGRLSEELSLSSNLPLYASAQVHKRKTLAGATNIGQSIYPTRKMYHAKRFYCTRYENTFLPIFRDIFVILFCSSFSFELNIKFWDCFIQQLCSMTMTFEYVNDTVFRGEIQQMRFLVRCFPSSDSQRPQRPF